MPFMYSRSILAMLEEMAHENIQLIKIRKSFFLTFHLTGKHENIKERRRKRPFYNEKVILAINTSGSLIQVVFETGAAVRSNLC